jgi:hypothetical protein
MKAKCHVIQIENKVIGVKGRDKERLKTERVSDVDCV